VPTRTDRTQAEHAALGQNFMSPHTCQQAQAT